MLPLWLSPPQKPPSRKIGKREIERARGTMGRGKKGRKPTAFSSSPRPPHAYQSFLFYFIFLIFVEIIEGVSAEKRVYGS